MIKMIVAHDKNFVIGKDNKMPWHFSEDLKYFKKTTLQKDVLMGSKTFNSIISYLGKPLPNRNTKLLTSKTKCDYDVEIFNTVEEVLKAYKDKELFVAGGSSVYEQFMPYADYLYITHIDQEYIGDTYFPTYDLSEWELISSHKVDVLDFRVYERITK